MLDHHGLVAGGGPQQRRAKPRELVHALEDVRRLHGIIIGREGLTGLAVVLGQDRARHTTYMQAAGAGSA